MPGTSWPVFFDVKPGEVKLVRAQRAGMKPDCGSIAKRSVSSSMRVSPGAAWGFTPPIRRSGFCFRQASALSWLRKIGLAVLSFARRHNSHGHLRAFAKAGPSLWHWRGSCEHRNAIRGSDPGVRDESAGKAETLSADRGSLLVPVLLPQIHSSIGSEVSWSHL